MKTGTGWFPPTGSVSEFKPVTLPLGAATPGIYPPPNNDSDTLVDIAKKLERVIELLEKQLQLMQ